jgi:murein DD-endopeptidase MepM/ murein hydrolase activator NlpD
MGDMSLIVARALFLLSVMPGAVQAEPLRLQPPVQSACVSSPFGWRRAIGPNAPAGLHNGIDLPAPAGAIVRAAAAGRVGSVKRQGLGGIAVSVIHADGITTLYAHLGNLAPAIAEGKRAVAAGDPLGRVGRTGVTYGTHLFFAVFVRGTAVDPRTLLDVPLCQPKD